MMSLQSLIHGGGNGTKVHSICRDVAYNFSFIMAEVVKKIVEGRWPANELMDKLQTSQEEMVATAKALTGFIKNATDPNYRTMLEAAEATHLFETNDNAQLANYAIIGFLMLGMFFSGVREASIMGNDPMLSQRDLIDKANELITAFEQRSKKE